MLTVPLTVLISLEMSQEGGGFWFPSAQRAHEKCQQEPSSELQFVFFLSFKPRSSLPHSLLFCNILRLALEAKVLSHHNPAIMGPVIQKIQTLEKR